MITNSPLGKHLLLELYECDRKTLNNIDKIKTILVSTAKAAMATVIETSFHHFSPHGVSGVVIISESHITIHTWPEHSFAAIDLFTCNDNIAHESLVDTLVRKFSAQRHQTSILTRGEMNKIYPLENKIM